MRVFWSLYALALTAFVSVIAVTSALEVSRLPEGIAAAEGVRVDGEAIPPGADARAAITARADALRARRVELFYQGTSLGTFGLDELEGQVAIDDAVTEVLAVGRRGNVLDRVVEARRARAGRVDVALRLSIPVDAMVARLAEAKDALDVLPRGARRLTSPDRVEPHVAGRFLDAYDAVERVAQALRRGEPRVELAPFAISPAATEEAARAIDVSVVVSRFETRFGGPPGRDQNILRATSLLDGLVLMPGDEVSFNRTVGARSVENGFALAPEIYRGESRLGVGGGACQVSSTLYAAAFFGGLEVLERQNHSRPSAYIRPGLDATVSYPVLDLKLKNNFAFPVVVKAELTPGVLSFSLLGRDKPVAVELATETVSVGKLRRKIEKASWLGAGEFRVKQKGKRGMSIKRTKTIRDKDGRAEVEVSTDVYPTTQEILLVGPDTDESTLPPLPDGAEVVVAAR